MGTITKGFIGREDLARWTGSTTYTYDRGTSTGSTQALTRMGNVVDAVMFGDGTTRTQLVLQNAINESSEERIIELSHGSWVITTSMTIPSYVTLSIPRGAVLTVNGGTFTISGSILAGDYQIFAGVGDVVFSTAREVYAGWWPDWTTAAGVAWTNAIASISAVGGTVRLPGGAATSTTCVDMTSLQGYYWEVVGESNSTRITFAVATHGIDCSGSNHLTFKDFTVAGDTTTTPQTGFFFARDPDLGGGLGLNGSFHYMYNIIFSGAFSKANVYSYAAEECRYYNCYFNNSEDDSCNVWMTEDNDGTGEDLDSVYITIATSDQSNSDNKFFGCSFLHTGSPSADNVDNMRLRGVLALDIYGSFWSNGGTSPRSHIYIDNDGSNTSGVNLNGFRFETGYTVDYGIYVASATSTVAHLSVSHGYFGSDTGTIYTPASSTLSSFYWKDCTDAAGSTNGMNILGTVSSSDITEFGEVNIATLEKSVLRCQSTNSTITTSTKSVIVYSDLGSVAIDSALNYTTTDNYKWVEDFDDEASAVQWESGLNEDFWTTAGTNYAAANVTYSGGIGGTLDAKCAAADNDSVNSIGSALIKGSLAPKFEARLKIDTKETVFWAVGLVGGAFVTRDTAGMDDDVILLGQDTEVSGNLVLVTRNSGAAPVRTALGISSADNTYFTVKLDGTDEDQPRVWINGTEIAAAVIAANTFDDTEDFYVYFMVQNLAGGAIQRTLTLDYIKVWQDRE